MKKIIIVFPLLAAFTANAQGAFTEMSGYRFFAIAEQVIMAYLTYSFLLGAIKIILGHRIKKTMMEKGISEDILKRFMNINNNEVKQESLKWFFLLASTGLGVFLVSLFPTGILSIAILIASISLGFLINFCYLKYFINKQE